MLAARAVPVAMTASASAAAGMKVLERVSRVLLYSMFLRGFSTSCRESSCPGRRAIVGSPESLSVNPQELLVTTAGAFLGRKRLALWPPSLTEQTTR